MAHFCDCRFWGAGKYFQMPCRVLDPHFLFPALFPQRQRSVPFLSFFFASYAELFSFGRQG